MGPRRNFKYISLNCIWYWRYVSWILTTKKTLENKVILMYFVGVVCLLDSFLWEWLMPINKNLWTSTYVMHTTGWAF